MGIDVGQFLRILRARKWLVLRVFMSVVLLVLAGSLIMKKKYQAVATVVFNSKSTDPVSGAELQSDFLPSALATQADIIASHQVALKVVDRLRLASSPDFRDAWDSATDGAGSLRDWIAILLVKKYLLVEPSAVSNVLVIGIVSESPDLSVALANAWADAYIQTSLELKSEPARRQAAWFAEQNRALRSALELAQKRLSDYQRANSVLGTDDRIDVENGRLTEVANQLVLAQNSMYEGQARLQQMNEALRNDKLEQLPDIIGNPLLQSMTADLARAEGVLAQTAARFGHNHPQYQSAQGQVVALKQKLSAEIENARGSIEKNTDIAVKRVAELEHALAKQRDRVLSVKRQQDDVNVLKRDVDNAQRSYEAGLTRASQVQLEGRLDQGNVAVLSRAVPPFQPTSPRILLNTALSIVFGATLGVAWALWAEMRDRRLRAASDVLKLEGLPLLAVVPAAPKRRRRRGRLMFWRRAGRPLLQPQGV